MLWSLKNVWLPTAGWIIFALAGLFCLGKVMDDWRKAVAEPDMVIVQCDHSPDPSMRVFMGYPPQTDGIYAIFKHGGNWHWAMISDTVVWKADTLIHPCFVEGSVYRDHDNMQWNPEYGRRCE